MPDFAVLAEYTLDGGFLANDTEHAARIERAVLAAIEDTGGLGAYVRLAYVTDATSATRDAMQTAWQATLTTEQQQALDGLRREQRSDPAHADAYRLLGVDAEGRPVLQRPASGNARDAGGYTLLFAVQRSGATTLVTGDIKPMAQVLMEFAGG